MVIAIDGPAGAGKSTVARAVAKRLGFTYLDTGAMYRCVALADIRNMTDSLAIRIDLDKEVRIDGENVTQEIRAAKVSERASVLSQDPDIRAALVRRQQQMLAQGDWVAEGRDIGTVVAPHAKIKIFLTADEQERARRRAKELGLDVETVLRDQQQRDQRDIEREHAPLVAARDAVVLDTTDFTIPQVIDHIVKLVGEQQ